MTTIKGQIEFSIVEHTAEKVRAEMPVLKGILNPYGVANAGAILWFADVAASHLAMGRDVQLGENMAGFPLAISLNANLLSNQRDGVFVAESVYVRRGRTLTVVRTTVTGADGKLIADVTTTHVPAK